jgi:hypothetical protein
MIAILLVMLCSVAHAQATPSAAAQHLSKVGVFAFGGVGFVGKTSEGEKDFRIVMSQPAADALASLETLYAHGTPAAKSYALVGIRKLDRERFEELVQPLESSKEKVFIMEGCIMQDRSLGDIARAIDSGAFAPSLKSNDQPQ